MHELGIVIHIVKQMENYMDEQKIDKINTLVLEVGELSGVYPKYLEDLYPIAVEKSRLKDTKLKLEIVTGIGKCLSCGLSYPLVANDNTCPLCQSKDFEILTGQDFMIKEIHVE